MKGLKLLTVLSLAILTASFLLNWARAPEQLKALWQRVPLAIFGFVGFVVLAGGAAAAWYLLPDEIILASLGALPLLGAAICLYFVTRQQIQRAAIVFVTAAVLFLTGIFGWGAVRISRYQNGASLAEAIQGHINGPRHVAAFRAFRPSWVFYADQPIPLLVRKEQLVDFLDQHHDAVVITSEERWREVRSELDPTLIVLANRPRFLLKKQRYVVVAKSRKSMANTTAVEPRTASRTAGNRR